MRFANSTLRGFPSEMRGGKRHVEARTPEAVPAASQAPAWKAGQRLPRARPAPPAPGCPSRAGRCLGVPSPRTFSHPGRRRLRAKSAPDLAPRGARPPVHIRRWGCARRSGCRGPESVPPSVGAPRADRCEGPRGSEREGSKTSALVMDEALDWILFLLSEREFFFIAACGPLLCSLEGLKPCLLFFLVTSEIGFGNLFSLGGRYICRCL